MATNRCRNCTKPLELIKDCFCGDECRRTYRARANAYTEEVNGVIIGGNYNTYEFWPHQKDAHLAESLPIAKATFDDDEQAIEWFHQQQPEWFARGVEMRVF